MVMTSENLSLDRIPLDDVKIGEILEPGSEEETSRREKKVRERFWPKLARSLGRVPFAEDVVASYYCALDPHTPTRTKGILLAALAYFILPLDTLPDFLLGFGFTDDLAVIAAAVSAVRGSISPAHRKAARDALVEISRDDKPAA